VIPYPGGAGKAALKPLFKYTGGKGKLIKHYLPYMPHHIETYVEPFLGGGSMFLYVMGRYAPSRIVLGDANAEIMNIYQNVRDDIEGVVEILDMLIEQYVPMGYDERKAFYLRVREEYAFGDLPKGVQAAYLYFMLSTCFNGQYVVTTNGRFYTSPGELTVKNPVNRNNVLGWNKALQKVELFCGDWKKTLDAVEPLPENSFVFLDPPYRESNLHENQYMNDFFGDDDIQNGVIRYTRDFPSNSVIFLCNMERDEFGFFDNLGEGLETVKIRRKVTTYSFGEADHFINEVLVHNNTGETNVRLDQFFWSEE
jgi:DNA adenine methylase